MRIELTFPDQSRETADLKSGTGTSSVTSPVCYSIFFCIFPLPLFASYPQDPPSVPRRCILTVTKTLQFISAALFRFPANIEHHFLAHALKIDFV
jgi:hypothetical protein